MTKVVAGVGGLVFAGGVLLLLMLAGAGYHSVPLAPPSVVAWYINHADELSEEHDVSIDWRDVISVDAVRLDQDWDRVTENWVRQSLEAWLDEHEPDPEICPADGSESDAGDEGQGEGEAGDAGDDEPDCEPYFEVKTFAARMAELGFTAEQIEWAEGIRASDLDALVDVGADCVPEDWTPRPAAGWTWPLPGHYTVTSCFGPRVDPVEGIDGQHHGLDVAAPLGAHVVAAKPGTVLAAGNAGACGVAVLLAHDGGYRTRYCHLTATAVSNGQTVEAGDVIGYAGSTGKSTGVHLHFEVMLSGRPVDPITYYHRGGQ